MNFQSLLTTNDNWLLKIQIESDADFQFLTSTTGCDRNNGQISRQSVDRRCTIYKQTTKCTGPTVKLWRGYRSTIACSICLVNLCLPVKSDQHKICLEVWNSASTIAHCEEPLTPRELADDNCTESEDLQSKIN